MITRVGILALQGAFFEHEKTLTHLGVDAVEVRLPIHLKGLDGLIIPGGESTTLGKLAKRWDLLDPIRAFARSGRPLWGTCAGAVLMARKVAGSLPGQPLLGLMDIAVVRNAFGRQVESFEADLMIPIFGSPAFRAIFIRAPMIERVGKTVQVLARLDPCSRSPNSRGVIVAAQQDNLLTTSFHPELTKDDRFHIHFLDMCQVTGCLRELS